ncbi:MAG: hypothetical protein AAF697_11405 [Pseudomonadota bacterium]
MDSNVALLFILVISIATVGFIINNWIRMKNGHAPSDDWTGLAGLVKEQKSDPEKDQLIVENQELKGQLNSMQDRMVVLEKIVTDRGYSLSEEIEALRDSPASTLDAGVPLNLNKKEQA